MTDKKRMLTALLVMLLWGSLFPMVKVGYAMCGTESVGDILLFAGVRFVICGAVITLYCAVRHRDGFVSVGTSLFPVLLSGFFAIVLHYGFTYVGLMSTAGSKTALLKQSGVLIYVCISHLFFRDDRFSIRKLAGVIIGFCGIAAMNIGSDGFSWRIADTLIVAASFCTVISNIISKKVFVTANPVVVTGISQFFGGAVLLIAGILMEGRAEFTSPAAIAVFAYICTASVFGYCLWYIILADGELSGLLIIKFAEPAFAACFGAVILHENIFGRQYLISFPLIFIGIYIANRKNKNAVTDKM